MMRSYQHRIGLFVIGGSLATLAVINCAFQRCGVYEVAARWIPEAPFIARLSVYGITAVAVIVSFHVAGLALLRRCNDPARASGTTKPPTDTDGHG
jgi:hypothetical protein